MALTEKTEWYVGINEDSVMEIRKDRVILDNGISITSLNTRYVLEPGQDVTAQPQKIRQLANFIWTPAVIAAWQAKKAAQGGL